VTLQDALAVGGVAAAALAAFALAAAQSYLNGAIGTDHAVHAFLVRMIRTTRFRLFDRVPHLLNETHCAALPLYLHWLFAWFGDSAMRRAERLLNPVINALLVALFAFLAAAVGREIGASPWFVAAAAAAFALTPQFYHALSARNFGLSARGIGLFLLAGVFLLGHAIEAGAVGAGGWLAIAIAAYLLWAFNTFGGQALVILGTLAAVLFGHWVPLAGGVLGLALFVAIHPIYATRYLYHTLRFIRGYATELAPVYVLARRHSIWRDLVWDIWRRTVMAPAQGIRYAYENSALIVVGLNPLWTLSALAWATGALPRGGAIAYATDIALAGGLAAFLTSFRLTRFLGEPERYVEAAAPFAAAAGAAAVMGWGGIAALVLVAAAFLVVDLAQVYVSRMLQRHIAAKPIDLGGLAVAASRAVAGPIRCAGNNDQLIKQLLMNDWSFVYCMAIEGRHCGMPLKEVFSVFPFVRREALQRIVRDFRINLCVLDCSIYDTLFDAAPAGLVDLKIIHETAAIRVLALRWADGEE
jgi:hypothetical protein